MFCSQTISVYIMIQQRISALSLQSILSREEDMEVLVLPPHSCDNLRAIIDFRPDIVITDETTCGLHSPSALAEIKRSGATRFLFLCAPCGDEAAEVVALGADGVISRTAPAELLAVAVRSLARGRAWFDENIWRDNLDPEQGAADSPEFMISRLSSREIEMLRLASEGFSNRQIAIAMNLSHEIIKCCMWLIVRKLRARGRIHAVSVARKSGMFSSSGFEDAPT
jgi:two-component system, NarL family, response regulator DesR